MARQPIVSRTFKTLTVSVLAVDLESEVTVKKEVTLPRNFKEDKVIISKAEEVLGENFKVVRILDKIVNPVIYGMTEEDFIKNAYPITRGKSDTENAD